MKNILVATDHSPKAELAAKVGMALAAQFDAEIHFFSVVDTPVDWAKLPKEQEDRFTEAKARIGAVKGKLDELEREAIGMGLNASYFISFSNGNKSVLQHIKSRDHDLVVIGAHSRLTVTDVLFGSVAIEVIQGSTVPVLLVDETTEFSKVSSVLVAVDPNAEPLSMIREVAELFPSGDVVLKAFAIESKGDTATEDPLAGLNGPDRDRAWPKVTYESVSASSVEQGIIEKANSKEGEILVIGTNKFNSVADYLRAHVFPSISARIQVPLLILRSTPE